MTRAALVAVAAVVAALFLWPRSEEPQAVASAPRASAPVASRLSPPPLPALGEPPLERPADGAGTWMAPVPELDAEDHEPSPSERGFVPSGGVVDPGSVVEADHQTIDFADPQELAFKAAAGDLKEAVDEDALIKRNAYDQPPDGFGVGSTDEIPGAPSDTELEYHEDGDVRQDGEPPRTSETEPHRDGRGPMFDWRAAGLSPTEADAVPVPDLTNTVLAAPPPPVNLNVALYRETVAPAPVIAPWTGPGTDTTPRQ